MFIPLIPYMCYYSSGIVSNLGQEPVASGEAKEFLVTGPMCRYVQDLTPILKVLAAGNSHMLKLDQKVRRKVVFYYQVVVML